MADRKYRAESALLCGVGTVLRTKVWLLKAIILQMKLNAMFLVHLFFKLKLSNLNCKFILKG